MALQEADVYYKLYRDMADMPLDQFPDITDAEPYCFYCVICSQRLNYWETLQLHLNQCRGKHEHSKKKQWQASAEHACDYYILRYYEKQAQSNSDAVILSGSRKVFNCRACGATSQPWFQLQEHLRSSAHKDAEWKDDKSEDHRN